MSGVCEYSYSNKDWRGNVPKQPPDPLILLKSRTTSIPDAQWLESLSSLGIYGTEVRLDVDGTREQEKTALAHLDKWIQPWLQAGLRIYIHPYTEGLSEPAACEGASGGPPLASFRRLADYAASLADRSGDPVTLTYHAAGARPAHAHDDPRLRRHEYLERSIRFFRLAFDYVSSIGDHRVRLTSETQLPTRAERANIRIGDRPEEVIATLGHVPLGICWDTGHYLLSTERLGAPKHPPAALVDRVRHMHVHDVVDGKDHRPLRKDSCWVAYYVGLAAATGHLESVTLEYDYRRAFDDHDPSAHDLLEHIAEAAQLVRQWASSE